MSSTVSKRQNNRRASPTSSAGSPALTRAALSPSRSHAASGVASRPRRVMTVCPCAARTSEDVLSYSGCARAGARSRSDRRSARRWSARLRRPRRAPHEDAGAVASIDLGIDVFEDHHAAVEGDDFTILHARRAASRADVILAGRAALEAKLLQLAGIGEIHHDAAVRPLADHVGLLALAAGIGLGARGIFRLVIGGVSPTADDLGGPHVRRDFGLRRPGGGDLRRGRGATGRERQRGQRDGNDRPTEIAIPHRRSSLTLFTVSARDAAATDGPNHFYRPHG